MRIVTRLAKLETDKVSGFYAARPGNAPKPGLLFVHHANGVTSEIREFCERAARLGYGAFAVNMFHALGAKGEGQMGMGGPMQHAEQSCVKEGLRPIDVRHEQAAALMAQAYSRLRQKPGWRGKMPFRARHSRTTSAW